MRLLLITNRYPTGPDDTASPCVPYFVNAVRDCGIVVDVLTPRYGVSRDVTEGGSETRSHNGDESVFRFETGVSIPIGSWNLFSPGAWLRLFRFMRNGRRLGDRLCAMRHYDHILALWALPSGHFAQALSKRFRVPYSVWCLGSDIYVWPKRPLIRGRIASVLHGAKHVFGDGDDLCRRIHQWLGIEAVFLPSFRPLAGLDDRTSLQPTETPRFLYLGRLHPAKGVFDLLTAFAKVRQTLPGATLRFVGDGPAAGSLRERAMHLGLAPGDGHRTGVVTIVGAVSQDGVVKSLKECDCVVIPTRSDSVPLVFTEAVQARRPIVGTDVGDLGSLIRRYRVGLVTPSADANDLAATMIQAARSPVFDMEGRARLLDRFDPRHAAQSFCTTVLRAPDQPSASRRQVNVASCASP